MYFVFHLGLHRDKPCLCICRKAFPWMGTIYSQSWPKECSLCAVRVLDTKTCCTIIKPQGSLCCRVKAGAHHVAHWLTELHMVWEKRFHSVVQSCVDTVIQLYTAIPLFIYLFFFFLNREVSKGLMFVQCPNYSIWSLGCLNVYIHVYVQIFNISMLVSSYLKGIKSVQPTLLH